MNDSPLSGVGAVLEMLSVPRNGVLYAQASVDWIQRAGFGAAETLAALRTWTGDRGTLVMPTYPFNMTHQEYLEGGPVYDAIRTPAAIGLLPEMFRRTPGARRSLDPDFCITALGTQAEAIAGAEPAALDPFGTDSSYQRMLDRRTTLVGLGVSLNTNSFIHVIDSRAAAGYPSPVYDERMFSTTVIDPDGRSRDVPRKALRPIFQQQTSPSEIIKVMQPSDHAFASVEINGARFFRWDLDEWSQWCLAHARDQAAAGAWPCWLSRLG